MTPLELSLIRLPVEFVIQLTFIIIKTCREIEHATGEIKSLECELSDLKDDREELEGHHRYIKWLSIPNSGICRSIQSLLTEYDGVAESLRRMLTPFLEFFRVDGSDEEIKFPRRKRFKLVLDKHIGEIATTTQTVGNEINRLRIKKISLVQRVTPYYHP